MADQTPSSPMLGGAAILAVGAAVAVVIARWTEWAQTARVGAALTSLIAALLVVWWRQRYRSGVTPRARHQSTWALGTLLACAPAFALLPDRLLVAPALVTCTVGVANLWLASHPEGLRA